MDIETTGLDPLLDTPLLIAFDEVVFLAPRTSWVRALGPILEDTKIEKVLHNAPFDSMFFQKEGIKPRSVCCTETGARLLKLGLYSEKGSFGLVNLLDKCLGVKLDAEHKLQMQLSFVGQDPATFWPTEEQLDYVCSDTSYLKQLRAWLTRELGERGMLDVWKLENAFTQVQASMQLHGSPFDVEKYMPILEETEREYDILQARLSETLTPPILEVRRRKFEQQREVREAWEDVYSVNTARWERMADDMEFPTRKERRDWIREVQAEYREGNPRPDKPKLDTNPINLNSNDQVQAALHELGLDPLNMERDTLLRLKAGVDAKWHSLLDDLAEYSRLEKVLSSYGRGLLERIHPDGRLRSNYEMVATGRLSSSKWKDKGRDVWRGWNSQNAHPKTKQAVVAPAGRKFTIVDYSQIELRVCAEFILRENPAATDALVKAFRDGMDPHSLTAAEVSGMPYAELHEKYLAGDEEITRVRKGAKTTNFSVVFGIAAPKLAVRIYADRGSKGPFGPAQVEEAQKMIKAFWKLNPTLQKILKGFSKQALDLGYTTTLAGRRRHYKRVVPGTAEWHAEKGNIERAGANAPIQGTAQEIVKLAAVFIWIALEVGDFIWNAVHDEICTEHDEAKDMQALIRDCCMRACRVFLKHVPGDVSIGEGKQWKH